jgi:Na+-driven multidrug efflux pump
VNLFIYYIIGVPLAYLIGLYFGHGIIGIVSGIFVAATVQCVAYVTLIMRTDWKEQA